MQTIPKEKFEIIGVEPGAERIARPQVGYLKDVWRRFRKNKLAIVALIMLVVLAFFVIFGPAISGYSYEDVDPTSRNASPSAEHWFGTDSLGRDLFARVWQGGRVSLIIGFLGALISATVGCLYGGISAYFGGKVDSIMQRIQEVINSIPTLVVLTILLMVMQSNLFTIILALAFTEWIGMSRITRAQVLKTKEEEFVLASRTLGASSFFIIFKEILPNIYSQMIIMIMMSIPNAIFYEAYLSFVGLGLPIPEASLGTLINDGFNTLTITPYQMTIPVIVFSILMLSFNLVGDGLRDALDPTMKEM